MRNAKKKKKKKKLNRKPHNIEARNIKSNSFYWSNIHSDVRGSQPRSFIEKKKKQINKQL